MPKERKGEPLPRLEPMLAQTGEPFDSPEHVFEIKWDGTRCVTYAQRGALNLINRRGFELLDRYPELEPLRALPHGTILDAEIVVLENGRPNFRKLQQREQQRSVMKVDLVKRFVPATMIVFDAMWVAGRDITGLPLRDRGPLMRAAVAALASPHVIAPEGIVGPGTAMFARMEQEGMEGLIAKRLGSSYQPGVRSPDWLKIKVAATEDFEVLGYTPGTVKGMLGALLIGHRKGRGWEFKGKVGSGFTDQERVEVLAGLSGMAPLPNPPSRDVPTDAVWRATGLTCRVRYFEKTHTGHLRAPVFKGFVVE